MCRQADCFGGRARGEGLSLSVLMSCPVLVSCSVCLSICLLSSLNVEILTEKSHNALCSKQPTAKGLIIIGASQGKADTSIHPGSNIAVLRRID